MERHKKKKHTALAVIIVVLLLLILAAVSTVAGYLLINPDALDSAKNETQATPNPISSTAPPTAVPGEEDSPVYLYTMDYAEMYESPDEDSEVIAELEEGERVSYLERADDYTKVSYNESEGYIETSLLSESRSGRESTSSKSKYGVKAPEGTMGVCHVQHDSGTDIFFRSEPSESAEVTDYIPDKTTLYVLSTDEDWTKVSYNEKEGYVKTRYIVMDREAQSSVTSADGEKKIMTVTGVSSAVYLRSDASDAPDSFLTTVPANAEVEVLGEEGSYYKVSYGGEVGYLPSKYLK